MAQTTRLLNEAVSRPFYPAGSAHFITGATNYGCLVWVITGFFFLPVPGLYPTVTIDGVAAIVVYATDTLVIAIQGAGTPAGVQTLTVTNSLGFSDSITVSVCTPSGTQIVYVSSIISGPSIQWNVYGRGFSGGSAPTVTVGAFAVVLSSFSDSHVQFTTNIPVTLPSIRTLTIVNNDTGGTASLQTRIVDTENFASLRTVTATNQFETTINPPANVVITPADPVRQIHRNHRLYSYINERMENKQGVVKIRRVGVYDNFSNRMITPDTRINVDLTLVNSSFITPLDGFLALGVMSKAVTGIGTAFTTDLSDGDYIICGQTPGVAGAYPPVPGSPVLLQVDHVIDDTNLTLRNYPPYNDAPVYGRVRTVATETISMRGIDRLNDMKYCEMLFPAMNFSAVTGELFLLAQLRLDDTIEFSTADISGWFAGNAVYFDVCTEVGFTIFRT